MIPSERAFEEEIEAWLLEHGGYLKSEPSHFDAVLGLDTAELFAFIGATQLDKWDDLKARHGGDPNVAQRAFAKRLAAELDGRSTVDVLRHGVIDHGVEIQLAYFKPAHALTPELAELYGRNRVTITRQFPYEANSHKTIDIALLVNGIPVATAELKNELTHQTVDDAIRQYRKDRDPKNPTLSRRALVHFAVDSERVAMTTRLNGLQTAFLPFNRGHNGRKGNPPNPAGHRTSYLWEEVWSRDPWLDILQRFIHVEGPAKGRPGAKRAASVIFPRYHQWDAVLTLEDDARRNGAGCWYLIEHSAGSGKSNTIAWLVHRLASLHDEADGKIFDKVVVITDRVVLDQQLQDTIYQLEHARGVVEKIDQPSKSKQLADALTGEKARIIVTTLQTFPYLLDKIAELPTRRYAVVVDEAHSSQTGEAAKDLKVVLGATSEEELTAAEIEDRGLVAEPVDPVEEALAKQVAARGRQENLSFFAFTATPKARTLETFGTLNPKTGKFEPFHLYPMRQAIDEGFILDVLDNYTTYKTFWKIEKEIAEDPVYEAPKARRAIARFVELHPTALGQKAEIIVEHFRAHVAPKVGGKAKAMVVTSSRLHAVKYKSAIDDYIDKHDYTDLSTLVAFSGKVIDEKGFTFTEASMNAFPASETAGRFKGEPSPPFDPGDYQVMIVAEKFQTGFDLPLLHTMYVDKVLTGLSAVQTLSRLNRTHPEKTDTFVLDFRNETEEIVKAFEPYYGQTVAPPTDPNLLYVTRQALDNFDILRPEEVEETVVAILKVGEKAAKTASGRVNALLDPAVERFRAMDEEDRLVFKDALDKFIRTYSFLAQVVSFGDSKLERDYIYCRALSPKLRSSTTVERLDLGDEVELSHLRNEVTFQGSLSLDAESGEVATIFGEGRGRKSEPQIEHLSEIIAELNEHFGMGLTERDRLTLDQVEEDMIADPDIVSWARANTLDNFRLPFDERFLDVLIERMEKNEDIVKRVLDDRALQAFLKNYYATRVYRRARTVHEDS